MAEEKKDSAKDKDAEAKPKDAEAEAKAPRRAPTKKEPAAEKPSETKAEKAAEEKPAAERKPRRAAAAKEKEGAKEPAAEKPAAAQAAAASEKAPARRSRTRKAASEKPPAEKAKGAKGTEKAPAERPARRRGGAAAAARRPVVRAHARYVRTSARKARMVCGHLRGKSVQEARAILAFSPRQVGRDWSKLLESAVANAETNHELVGDDLIVREAYADEGPTIKRFRPRAMGRATPIAKRTSHLTITLTPRP